MAIGYPAEDPLAEDVSGCVRYYLDDDDRLHVPKLTADLITDWR